MLKSSLASYYYCAY